MWNVQVLVMAVDKTLFHLLCIDIFSFLQENACGY